MSEVSIELVERALTGEDHAVQALVDTLTPVIHARVARALMRRSGSAHGRDVRQEMEDLVQEVFVSLFSDDGKVLRSWDPERGMGLRGFVGLVSEQLVAQVLRSRRRSPWTEDPTESSDFEGLAAAPDNPERRVASRQLLQALLEHMRAECSPLGMELFHRLWVRQQSVGDVCSEMTMSADAVYAWRSRLKRTLTAALRNLTDDPSMSGGRH